MTIVSKVEQDFTVVKNEIIYSSRLSMQSKFLLIYVISLPKDWEVSLNGLSKAMSNDATTVSEAAIRKCLKELKEVGYVIRVFDKDESGKMVGSHYNFYDTIQKDSKQIKVVKKEQSELNIELDEDKKKLLTSYLDYRKQMYRISPKSQKKKYKELKSITHLVNMFKKYSIEELKKAVEQTMVNEWSGIFPKKEKVNAPNVNRFQTI
jgi:hypothetical protein